VSNFKNSLFLLFWPKFDRVLNERRNRTVEKYQQVKLSLKDRGGIQRNVIESNKIEIIEVIVRGE
jgi:hypothetical protein